MLHKVPKLELNLIDYLSATMLPRKLVSRQFASVLNQKTGRRAMGWNFIDAEQHGIIVSCSLTRGYPRQARAFSDSAKNYYDSHYTDDYLPKSARRTKVFLNYSKVPDGANARIGRRIRDDPNARRGKDEIDYVDEHVPMPIDMIDARDVSRKFGDGGTPFHLTTTGFCLEKHPTSIADFKVVDEVRSKYYREMEEVVLRSLGGTDVVEKVGVFDHTLRTSGANAGLNALAGASQVAGSVPRVHCDYTTDSAPMRLQQLAKG